jgi:O-antigen/teichoic acid export membrane protein
MTEVLAEVPAISERSSDLTSSDQEYAEIGRDTARVASAAALRQAIGTLLLGVTAAVVARSLGASKFGVYAGGTAAYYLMVTVAELGFGVVAGREMAKHPESEGRLLRTTIQIQTAWSAVAAAALLTLGLQTGGVRGEVMIVLCPALLASGLSSARQLFTVRYWVGPLLRVDLATVAVQSTAMTILALLHAGVVSVAGALSAASCANAVVVALLARRAIGGSTVHAGDRRRLLRMAVPVGIASLLASAYFTIDQVLLGWLVSSRQLGEYAAAVRLLSMLVLVPGLVMAAGIPALARHAEDRAALSRLAGMLAHWLGVTAFPLAVGLLVFARPAVTLAFGSSYTQAIGLLRILMLAGIFSIAANLLGNILLAVNLIRVMLAVNVATLIVNVAGNVFLAPRYGAVASAWLTVACEVGVTSYAVVALRRRMSYRALVTRVWRPVMATALAAAVGVALRAADGLAIPLAIVTFSVSVLALGAWPAELLPPRPGPLRRLARSGQALAAP